MKYKVHQTYVTDNFKVVTPGIYDESEIDILEARKKTIITGVNTEVTTETLVVNDMAVIDLEIVKNNIEDKVKILKIDSTPKPNPVVTSKVDFNRLTEEELSQYKYVGKATAEKVAKQRSIRYFADYDDLDRRVPLKGGKKWIEVGAFEFNPIIKQELKIE